ncbi:MAG: heterodisulfide reductase-related iron-sulfur binding cluster [Anaerolineales bacterium]
MLTVGEKILFFLLVLAALGVAADGFRRMFQIIGRGDGKLYLDNLPTRAVNALRIYITQETTLRARPLTSLFHLAIVWGFTFYFLVNFGDLLEGYIPDFTFLGDSLVADGYHFLADVLSIAVLVGVSYFIVRRLFLPARADLTYRENVLLHPKVREGRILTDSMIVAFFILFHVGSRFSAESVKIALDIRDGAVMPFANLYSLLWTDVLSLNADTLQTLDHVFWWGALGSIVLFIPYFPHTKHAHLFMAPFNYLTRPPRTSLGEMPYLDIEDEDREQFGAQRLEHLPQTALVDAFACIMCNRCQDVCPAYATGKELSPAALEVNKRYMIKDDFIPLAEGGSSAPLIGNAISESAVWACTACGACIDICPVGNEPMLDILELRRGNAMMEGQFPGELVGAFNGMERQGNPWQVAEPRFAWAKGLDVPTVDDNPTFEILYWVGCAASYDPRAQITARNFVKILKRAGVNFAVLGEHEACTGDVARRAGREDLYFEMATGNVETLNGFGVRRIVATCPHCLHNLGKEYHQFGGHYEVIHHTELIQELIGAGSLPADVIPKAESNVTFHDPCYLGRHNGVYSAPRSSLTQGGARVTEMDRHGANSFCCGAGGAQFWKEEEPGDEAVSVNRYHEAAATGADVLAVGCPFCMQMFETARTEVENGPVVKDIAELIGENLPDN